MGKLNVGADALTRVEPEDAKQTNIKIEVNFIKNSVGIYSLREIERDQANLIREQKSKLFINNGLYLK